MPLGLAGDTLVWWLTHEVMSTTILQVKPFKSVGIIRGRSIPEGIKDM